MTTRIIKETDYQGLVKLYKSFFGTHNIFQQDESKVIIYLKEQARDNEFIVYEEKNVLKGALIIVKTGQNSDATHKIWKYRHFAFESEKIAALLLKEAEKYISKQSKTAKVELTIAENEKGIDFYKENGYKQEAALSNHYRWGETCYILSKSFN